jgi:hypothetical protein
VKHDKAQKQNAPKRLTLNKKVIKHLVIKTNVKTGVSAWCEPTEGPMNCGVTRMCTNNHNAIRARRA